MPPPRPDRSRRLAGAVRRAALMAALFVTTAAPRCSGGGYDFVPPPPPKRNVRGIATDGAPLVNATVTIVNTDGDVFSSQTDADGTYLFSIVEYNPPFLVRVEDGTRTLYSQGRGDAAYVHVTPFTDAALDVFYAANGTTAAAEFAKGAGAMRLLREEREGLLSSIAADLVPWLLDAGGYPLRFRLSSWSPTTERTEAEAILANTTVTDSGDVRTIVVTDGTRTTTITLTPDAGTGTVTVDSVCSDGVATTRAPGRVHVVDFAARAELEAAWSAVDYRLGVLESVLDLTGSPYEVSRQFPADYLSGGLNGRAAAERYAQAMADRAGLAQGFGEVLRIARYDAAAEELEVVWRSVHAGSLADTTATHDGSDLGLGVFKRDASSAWQLRGDQHGVASVVSAWPVRSYTTGPAYPYAAVETTQHTVSGVALDSVMPPPATAVTFTVTGGTSPDAFPDDAATAFALDQYDGSTTLGTYVLTHYRATANTQAPTALPAVDATYSLVVDDAGALTTGAATIRATTDDARGDVTQVQALGLDASPVPLADWLQLFDTGARAVADLQGLQVELTFTLPPTLPVESVRIVGTIDDGSGPVAFAAEQPVSPYQTAVRTEAIPTLAGTPTSAVLEVQFVGVHPCRSAVRITLP